MAVGNPFSRRGFLTVGAVGFGLSLGDFFRLKARADLKNYDAIAAKADSVIHIFLPGGMAHQESFDPKPFAPIEYRGEMGDRSRRRSTASRSARRLPQTAADRRQDHRHPLDDARRGGARARHAQHVHRLPPQPGAAVPEHGERRLATSSARGTTCRPTSASRAMPNVYAGTGYLQLVVLAVQPGERPGQRRLPRPGPEPARRRSTSRGSRRAGTILDAVNDHFAKQGEGGRPGGDGHVLPAGLQPDQLAEGPRGVQHRRRARRDPRRVRPQRRRPADADGPPAGRPRACGSSRCTYGGWDMHAGIVAGDEGADARRSTRRSRP